MSGTSPPRIEKAFFVVKKIGVFGSTPRGTSSASSGRDILVEFEKGGAISDHFMELIFYPENDSKNLVDLVTPPAVSVRT